MLFFYEYVPHKMEKMQKAIDYIFNDVWCIAHTGQSYGLSLFDNNAEIKQLIEGFHYSENKGAKFFNSHIETIYHFFSKFSSAQILDLKAWYKGNNEIEKTCKKDSLNINVRYNALKSFGEPFVDKLASFFKGLYSQSFLNQQLLKEVIGDIDDHYKLFVKSNTKGKCPFCGISDLKGTYSSKREAYDHYLPKSIYPFNSINFKNLVPSCHECNSTYKTSKDPAFTPKDPVLGRQLRKVFYPYSNISHTIDIKIDLISKDIGHLTPTDIELSFGPSDISEEIDTWKDVYGIKERYKAKLCTESDGKEWVEEVLDEWRWHDESAGEKGRKPKEFLDAIYRKTKRSPYTDCNFLKQPFLKACKEIGLFKEL